MKNNSLPLSLNVSFLLYRLSAYHDCSIPSSLGGAWLLTSGHGECSVLKS
jgi:hypothetical protein